MDPDLIANLARLKKAAAIAKKSLKTGVPVRKLILDGKLLNEDALNDILDPMKMTIPGSLELATVTL